MSILKDYSMNYQGFHGSESFVSTMAAMYAVWDYELYCYVCSECANS